ncbi:MAG: MurR/RpiR family transcriptional regulator [Kiloniellales bacterium]
MTETSDSDLPADFEELERSITRRYSALSGQLQRIARYLLENPDDAALATVTTIAEAVDVQPSSLIRFAKTFGFDGFSALQRVLRSHLIARAPSYRDRLKSLQDETHGRSGVEGLLHDFVEQSIASLEQLRHQADVTRIGRAIEILQQAETVFILARGRAFPVAFYTAYALNGLEKRCHLLDGVGGLTEREIKLVAKRDALIAVSFRHYTADVVRIAGEARERGVPVVAITDSPVSPLALAADVVLETREDESHAFRGLAAPLCLAQTLVMGLGQRLMDTNGKK